MLATTQREVRDINNIQSVKKNYLPCLINIRKTLGTKLLKEASLAKQGPVEPILFIIIIVLVLLCGCPY